MHPHTELEVVTYIVQGTFRHEDSLGNSFLLPAGSVECLSAGTGMEHAEHNASETDPLRMILMYFVPDTQKLAPSVTHQVFTESDRQGRWCHIAGPPGCIDTSVVIHQRANMYTSAMTAGTQLRPVVMSGQGAYLFLIHGDAQIENQALTSRDAVMVSDQPYFEIEALTACEILLVDVPLLSVSAETDAAIKGDVRVTDGVETPKK